MDCPICKVQLIVVERHKIEIDYCISCKGFWFDTGEIELLSELLNTSTLKNMKIRISSESSEKKRPCPRCYKNMEKVKMGNYSNVLLDKCPDDEGLWFDSGELSKASSHFASLNHNDNTDLINFLGEMISVNTIK